jgi:hypothetical protein
MDGEEKKQMAARTEARIVSGTKGMKYWDFRKQFCSKEGWRLQRTAPQTYEVLDNNGKKIGIFKSGEGFFAPPNISG